MKLLQEYEQMTKYDGRSFTMMFSSPDFPQDQDDEMGGEFVHWVRAITLTLHSHSGSHSAMFFYSQSSLLMRSLADLRLKSFLL
jgi:hypothetical protein